MPNISVHPNLAAVYRRKVEELESLLDDAQHKDEAMELIRSLIDKIVLTPKEGGGVDALLHGDLARILMLCSTGQQEAGQQKALRAAGAGGLSSGSRYEEALAGEPVEGFHCRWLRGQDLNL